MICYLDSSAVLAHLLHQQGDFNPFLYGETFVASMLLRLEGRRSLHRLRLEGRIDDDKHLLLLQRFADYLTRIDLLSLSEEIMSRAEVNWGSILGSLDSLHLATAIAYKEYFQQKVTLVTHDKALATAAKIQGFEVVG